MIKPVKQFNWWAVVDKDGKVWDVTNSRSMARNFRQSDDDKVVKVYLVQETKAMLHIPWGVYGSLEGRK
jgi:hypothetical protein